MAESKKSFLLYCDTIHTVKKLSNEQAGELFKHILSYVNDENPVIENVLIDLVFEPIKQSLKRDLNKWESIKINRSESGRLGGIKSGETRRLNKQNEANEASALKSKQNEANEAVSDSVSDSVIVSEKEKKELGAKKEDLEKKIFAAIASTAERKKIFYNSLVPFATIYSKETIRSFFDYWSESNKSGLKMKFELEKTWETNLRLGTWMRREKEKQNNQTQKPKPIINTPASWIK